MSGLKLDQIEKLLVESELERGVMRCVFRCPASGFEVRSSARVVAGEGLRENAEAGVPTGGALMESLARAVTTAFGSAFLLRRNRDGSSDGESSRFSADEKNLAIFRAFQLVSIRFLWLATEAGWVAADSRPDLATEFSLQLARAPIPAGYDEAVTARMMAEVAAVDGRLADAERALLERFVNTEIGSVDELLGRPALRQAELDEVSPGEVRRTMLMMVWALAVIDEKLHDNEIVLLAKFAEGLGISSDDSETLKHYAAQFAVDQALALAYQDGGLDELRYASARALATKLGISRDDADGMDARVRKRYGVF